MVANHPKLAPLAILLLTLIEVAQSQMSSLSFSSCISDCVRAEGCKTSDLKCMCKASRGDFLSEIVECTFDDCSQNFDVGGLLGPLQLSCDFIGTPIPQSKLASASSVASSLQNPTTAPTVVRTTTYQVTTSRATPTSASLPKTTASKSEARSTSTPTEVTTTANSATQRESSTTTVTSSTSSIVSDIVGAGSSTSRAVSSSIKPSSSNSDTSTDTATARPNSQTDSSPFAAANGASYRTQDPLAWIAMSFGVLLQLR